MSRTFLRARRGLVLVAACGSIVVLSGCARFPLRPVPETTYQASIPTPDINVSALPPPAPSAVLAKPAGAAARAGNIPNIWPVDDPTRQVLSPFGPRGSRKGRVHFHNGVDIKVPYKNPVVAAANGVVTVCRVEGAYGKVVVVDHGNGYETTYAHLSSCDVKVGQKVAGGEPVGRVGATGNATTPHLHYEIRQNGRVVDPSAFLP